MKYEVDEIGEAIKEFTGIDVKNIGKKHKYTCIPAKYLFYRICFENGISGTVSAYYTDCCRYLPSTGRKYHINKCKTDWDWNHQYKEFKKFLENG